MLLVAAAIVLAEVLAAAVSGAALSALRDRILLLLALAAGRGTLGWLATVLPQRAAAAVKLQLRTEIVRAATQPSAPTPSSLTTGEIAAVAGHGLDALDPYFARYLPEMIRAAIVPVAVLVVLLVQDMTAAVIVAGTLPLIPLFGALVGSYTARRTKRQWRVFAVLSHHFLDVVRGLPTLKVFGRAAAQADTIAQVTERYRIATMATLRVALLSALVLELAATVSVALVAVSVGLRLVDGELGLQTALVVLILAPEAYLPLRRAAAEYHTAAEGVAAGERGLALVEHSTPSSGRAAAPDRRTLPAVPDPGRDPLLLGGVTVRFPDRDRPALQALSLEIEPGEVTAVVGPSGCGKSTLLRVLLGLCTPDTGAVMVGGIDLATVDLAAWHRLLAWLPQRPHFVGGSVRANLALGRTDADEEGVRAAAARAVLPDVPAILDRPAESLSAGQRQRLALARVFLRADAPLWLLDEPTAHLDDGTERRVRDALAAVARGHTVILVTHRPALLDLAQNVVDLSATTLGDAHPAHEREAVPVR